MHVYASRRRADGGMTRKYLCHDCQHRVTVKNDTGAHLTRNMTGDPLAALSCLQCVHSEDPCDLGFPEATLIGHTYAQQCSAFMKPKAKEPSLTTSNHDNP
jgi:hypothetical protein